MRKFRRARAMMDSYSALVSGMLVGMSEGLQQSPQARQERRAQAMPGPGEACLAPPRLFMRALFAAP